MNLHYFQQVDRVIKKPDNLTEIFGSDSEDADEPEPPKKKRKGKSKKKREPTPETEVSPDEKEDDPCTSSEYSN